MMAWVVVFLALAAVLQGVVIVSLLRQVNRLDRWVTVHLAWHQARDHADTPPPSDVTR